MEKLKSGVIPDEVKEVIYKEKKLTSNKAFIENP